MFHPSNVGGRGVIGFWISLLLSAINVGIKNFFFWNVQEFLFADDHV